MEKNKVLSIRLMIIIIATCIILSTCFFAIQNNNTKYSLNANTLDTGVVNNQQTIEDVLTDTINLQLNTLNLSNKNLTDITGLADLNLGMVSHINLAGNQLNNSSINELLLLSKNPQIVRILLNDNQFDLGLLSSEVLSNDIFIWGIQKFNFNKIIFNNIPTIHCYWNEKYNTNLTFQINQNYQNAINQTSFVITDGGVYNFIFRGQGNFSNYNETFSFELITVAQKHNLAFELGSDVTAEYVIKNFTFSSSKYEYGLILPEIDTSKLISETTPKKAQLIFTIEELQLQTSLQVEYVVNDTLAPVISIGEENVGYTKKTIFPNIQINFIDNGNKITNYSKIKLLENDDFKEKAEGKTQNILFYKVYKLNYETGKYEYQNVDLNEIDVSIVGNRYKIACVAVDKRGNVSEQVELAYEVVGNEIALEQIDEKLYETLSNMVYQISGIKRTPIFSSDIKTLNIECLELYSKGLSSIKGLEFFDLSSLSRINLGFNDLENDDMYYLNEIAGDYPAIDFVVFFNKITNAENYASNIMLGIQNLKSRYINNAPDSLYNIYKDYTDLFDLTIMYNRGLDNSTLFSANSIDNQENVQIFSSISNEYVSSNFPQTGYYTIYFISKDKKTLYSHKVTYATIKTHNDTLTIEAGSDFIGEALNFSNGISKNDFIIDVIDSETKKQLQTNCVGEYVLEYYVYDKLSDSEKGELITTLTQKVLIADTMGPNIEVDLDKDEYLYIGQSYVPEVSEANDVVDGRCEVIVNANIDIYKEGRYLVSYYSEDKLGNVTQIDRFVNVITKPIEKVFISINNADKLDNNEEVIFEINCVSQGNEKIGSNKSFDVYIDGKHILTTKECTFTYIFENSQSGRNLIEVYATSMNDKGESVVVKGTTYADIIDTHWLGKNMPITMVLFGFTILIFITWFFNSFVLFAPAEFLLKCEVNNGNNKKRKKFKSFKLFKNDKNK